MSAKHSHSKKNSQPASILIGRNALRELLRSNPERVERVLIAKGRALSGCEDLLDLLKEHNIQQELKPRNELSRIAQTDSHQSFVAYVTPRLHISLDEVISALADSPQAMIVVLDAVQDPHNFGAILRACECFGVDAVLWSKNRGSDITPTVTKVSAGASELLTLAPVANVAEALRKLKENEFWVVTADVEAAAQDLYAFDWPERAALVLGGEGSGVSALVQKLADFCVMIPQLGQIDSLNVSQAAAVLLSAYRRKSAV